MLDFISGALRPLSFDMWGQDFPKAMLGVKGYKCTKYIGLYLFVILLQEATGEARRKHLNFISGALGPLSFNIWGPNYPKALRGPMGYKCTASLCPVAIIGFFFFFFFLLVVTEDPLRIFCIFAQRIRWGP